MAFQVNRDRHEFLYNNLTNTRSGGSLSRKKGSGVRPKCNGNDRRRLSAIALRNPNFSSQKVANRFAEKCGKQISKSTAYRNLLLSGVGKILPKKIPLLTQIHMEKRVNFANQWKDYHFEDVFLSDESIFQLHRNTVRVWSSSRGKLPVKPTPKFGAKIMVWGAISFRGFYIKIVEGMGTISSSKYCQIIEEFLTFGDCLYPDGWILELDEATPHTARNTKYFFRRKILSICTMAT